jgi:hypothetical protein
VSQIERQEGDYSLLTVTHDQLEGAPRTVENVSGTGWMLGAQRPEDAARDRLAARTAEKTVTMGRVPRPLRKSQIA